MSISGVVVQSHSIQISQFWEEELKSMPYLTCKSIFRLLILICVYIIQRKTARHFIFLSPTVNLYHRAESAERSRPSAPSASTRSRSPRPPSRSRLLLNRSHSVPQVVRQARVTSCSLWHLHHQERMPRCLANE